MGEKPSARRYTAPWYEFAYNSLDQSFASSARTLRDCGIPFDDTLSKLPEDDALTPVDSSTRAVGAGEPRGAGADEEGDRGVEEVRDTPVG